MQKIKRHRKLEIHNSILKFYGSTKQENTNNFMIILEYVNEGSFRQYLKTNFQKIDWNTKLNLAKQIANVLMLLHSNDIIHGRFILKIFFNVSGITKTISDSLKFLTNILVPIQYMDPKYLKLLRMMNIHKYKEIYTDCWKHDRNSRPDIFQVVKNLSEIIISDASINHNLIMSWMLNWKIRISAANKIFNTTSNSSSLRKLYNINKEIGIIALANMYLYGLGIEKNIIKAIEIYFKLADKGSPIALNTLAFCYSNGLALAGNIGSMCNVGYCYENGIGVGKDEKEGFKWYLKAAKNEHNMSQGNVGNCYKNGGIKMDQVKAFEWYKKAAEKFFANSQYML
ncbi:hypothetical protein Glove_414g6 [Diversispora epigaea]|uniref:Tyrosine-protein kinase catalytic domain-containing protein n=1 Tax=Diversispora epigaea TaxID=1348612 RepID=A0A397H1J1_9GLOM|nr:hypothetical protein Glove_414g6 [Diversispora epigaea]